VAVDDRRSFDSFEAIRQALEAWPSPVPDVLARTDPKDVLRHRLFDLPCFARYTAGRFALLGDATHAMAFKYAA
jgi:2-polyprenyl-6-methoxyphenol hydroxylase-like FAD-dependent oxidoreductase